MPIQGLYLLFYLGIWRYIYFLFSYCLYPPFLYISSFIIYFLYLYLYIIFIFVVSILFNISILFLLLFLFAFANLIVASCEFLDRNRIGAAFYIYLAISPLFYLFLRRDIDLRYPFYTYTFNRTLYIITALIQIINYKYYPLYDYYSRDLGLFRQYIIIQILYIIESAYSFCANCLFNRCLYRYSFYIFILLFIFKLLFYFILDIISQAFLV